MPYLHLWGQIDWIESILIGHVGFVGYFLQSFDQLLYKTDGFLFVFLYYSIFEFIKAMVNVKIILKYDHLVLKADTHQTGNWKVDSRWLLDLNS